MTHSAGGFIPYRPERMSPEAQRAAGERFLETMLGRRSVRFFSSDPVDEGLIELAVAAASSAPSGANQQPWTFVAVKSEELKSTIREAAEVEERRFYEERASDAWLRDLEPLGTDAIKPFLEDAPWLVIVFSHTYGIQPDGGRRKHYYVSESVGIACGVFIAALQHMGLSTLTHTPSPMGFLGPLLGRPANEKAVILFPVGYPAADAVVPDLSKKALEDVLVWKR